jgi:hypothetical protein
VRARRCFTSFGPLLAGLLALAALEGAAAAQPQYGAVWRPKFQVAVGMGTSLDSNLGGDRTIRVPSFFFSAGVGAGLFGLDLRSFANGASNVQVSRLSVEVVGVARPFVLLHDAGGYGSRVLRTVGVHAGPAYERVSLGMAVKPRLGAALGVHVDFPIGAPNLGKELRIRVGARRMVGAEADLDDVAVRDSKVELYAQLAFVF